MIEIEHISKKYGELTALRDISFNLKTNEIVGLLGINGAGKSTLMRILSGIIAPDEGQINFFGQKFTTQASDMKKRIGFLSEDNPLYSDMYVREYLAYTAGIYHSPKETVMQTIEQTGLQNEYKKKIKDLSKGNRQRVGIAQALIGNPDFIILDEATSGLDPNQRENLNRLLLNLSENRIILFSTHILSEVKDICSRFVLIDKGRLIADKETSDIESIETIFHELTTSNEHCS